MKFILIFALFKCYSKFKFFFQLVLLFLFALKSKEENKANKYLFNIIGFDKGHLRYIDFSSNTNGDMIFYVNTFPSSPLRVFYGIKNNGRPFFPKDNYVLNLEKKYDVYTEKFESKTFFIKEYNNDKSEYLMSVGKISSNVEIYNFKNSNIYSKPIDTFSGIQSIESYRNEAISLFNNNKSEYLYFFGFSSKNPYKDCEKKFCFQIHKFMSVSNFNEEQTIIKSKLLDNVYDHKMGVSCFQTKNHLIICFFLTNDKKYNIIVFNFDLEEKNKLLTDILNINKFDVFYKCIHLKEEIGVFIYYENDIIPKFLFKSFENMKIQDYKFSSIILSNNDYNNYISANDLIK